MSATTSIYVTREEAIEKIISKRNIKPLQDLTIKELQEVCEEELDGNLKEYIIN